MKVIKISVFDTIKLYQSSLEMCLSIEKDFQIVNFFSENHEFELIDKLNDVDVLLIVVSHAFSSYLHLLNTIKENTINTKIIVIGNSNENEIIHDALNYGAKCFLTKETSIKELKIIIREVHKTGFYLTPEISNSLSGFLQSETKRVSANRKSNLNFQEITFLQYICNEFTNKEIAIKLNMSQRSVENLKNRILKKTEAKSVVGLVIYAFKNGIIEIERSI